jgi:hypothetical protein
LFTLVLGSLSAGLTAIALVPYTEYSRLERT